MFQGTFDVAAKKWIVTDARPINAEQDDVLSSVYSDENRISSTGPSNEESEAVLLEETMNSVYRAVQFILPPGRFAAVKRAQIEWLKKAQCRFFDW